MASSNSNIDGPDAEKRRELKITAELLTTGLENGKIVPSTIFTRFIALNFLELSESLLLTSVPVEIGRLSALTNLSLQGNRLEKLPDSIGDLKKLKYLDVSRNLLVELPSTIGGCVELQTLNVASNQLKELPTSLNQCDRLAHLEASRNEFESFPIPIAEKKLQHLADVSMKSNRIGDIPINISELTSLKSLDLCDNKIRVVPGELGECTKLKDLQMRGNELADRRLRKLIEDGVQKAILDYVKKHCPKTQKKEQKSKNKGASKKEKGDNQEDGQQAEKEISDTESDAIEPRKDKILITPAQSEVKIVWCKTVAEIRPHLLFCIVKNVDLADPKSMKEFLALQTKLHENQCNRRVAATIATHDLAKVEFPISYTSKAPEEIIDCTAAELVAKLTGEAEQLRKEKKRQVYSGLHQYLYLVKDKPKYCCLVDVGQRVISFPPITNSELTKMSPSTKDLLLEVTSDKDAATCKRVMDALLKGIFASSIIQTVDRPDGSHYKSMIIEQVKVETDEDTLKVAYPSKVDLNDFGNDVEVVREWKKGDDKE